MSTLSTTQTNSVRVSSKATSVQLLASLGHGGGMASVRPVARESVACRSVAKSAWLAVVGEMKAGGVQHGGCGARQGLL